MKILFGPAKNLANIAKHGVALSEAKRWIGKVLWFGLMTAIPMESSAFVR